MRDSMRAAGLHCPSVCAALGAAALSLAAGGCAAPAAPQPSRASPAMLKETAGARPVVKSTAPWSFQGHPGKVIRTQSYRIFTTETDQLLLDALPAFLEECLQRYTSEFGMLPQPPMQLDTFLMHDRQQWMQLTRQVMGDQSATYLLIDRGGFSSGGRALLWTIGRYDTLAIAAHEGWHQYTQRTFRDELPTWLEEGIGVYMEGFVAERARPLSPRPSGWANIERYEQLQLAASQGELMPLAELLAASPEHLIHSGTEATLTYYAQVWALVHFLREANGGLHRHALHRLLADAAEGRLKVDAGIEADGATIFRIFFDDDLARADREFSQFVMKLMAPGVRQRIGRGESPVVSAGR